MRGSGSSRRIRFTHIDTYKPKNIKYTMKPGIYFLVRANDDYTKKY